MSKYALLSVPTEGKLVLLNEDVFAKKGDRITLMGRRSVTALIVDPGMNGFLKLRVANSTGISSIPAGAMIQRPVSNVQAGYDISDQVDQYLQKGGHLEGYENGRKVVLEDADKGGMAVGAQHGPEGGIKGLVDGQKPIEFENREPVLSSKVSTDPNLYEFEGQKLTARQIASNLNVKNGGREFAEGGETGTPGNPVDFQGNEIILTAPVSSDHRTYNFEGKNMTALQVASELNKRNGGVSLV